MVEGVDKYVTWGFMRIVVGVRKVVLRLLTYVSRTRTCMWSAAYRDMVVVVV
jgi:hypothetical protein